MTWETGKVLGYQIQEGVQFSWQASHLPVLNGVPAPGWHKSIGQRPRVGPVTSWDSMGVRWILVDRIQRGVQFFRQEGTSLVLAVVAFSCMGDVYWGGAQGPAAVPGTSWYVVGLGKEPRGQNPGQQYF